nr:hypothetical protein GCM10020185_26540 [Pseudomonas brassicacearum subsp. brassicacearum]
MPAADVRGREVAVIDPGVQLLAPRQVGLQVTFVEGVLAPRRVSEATVVAGRLQFGFTEQDILEFDAEMGDVLDAVQRLLDGLGQHHAGRGQQIFSAQADDGIQPQGIFRGLILQVIVVLVAHLRRSIVLQTSTRIVCRKPHSQYQVRCSGDR